MSKKLTIFFVLVVLIALGFLGTCQRQDPGMEAAIAEAENDQGEANGDESTESRFTHRSRGYALRMFQQLEQDKKDRNLVFSPLSIEFMMGMIRSGATPAVADDIARAWGLEGWSVAEMNRNLSRVMGSQREGNARENIDGLNIANGIFFDYAHALNPAFEQELSAYRAEVRGLDFRTEPSAAVSAVNQWVDRNTGGRIPHIVDEFSGEPRAVLLNAVAFRGRWPENFFEKDRTQNKFFKGTGGWSRVPTMHEDQLSRYYEDRTVQAIYLRYRDDTYAMLVILPKDESAQGVERVVEKLDERYFSKILRRSMEPTRRFEGTLYLPRFAVESEFGDLVPKSKRIFDVALKEAPLSLLADRDSKTPLVDKDQLSEMIHKATITVDEEGTRAAAATFAGMSGMSGMREKEIRFTMEVDHPFVYAIVDKEGNIVFLGTVKDL